LSVLDAEGEEGEMKQIYNQEQFDLELKNGESNFAVIGFTAILWGNSHAVLWENSHAELWGNSHAELWGNSHAVLRENSHAELWGNSHAELWGNSHAELWGNSHAELWGNSHAELRENSHAVLRDFGFVHLIHDTATVRKISPRSHVVKVKYPSTMTEWCKLKGIAIKNGRIKLWKSVNKNGKDFYSDTILYDTKKEIVDPLWDKYYNGECGKGLHLADDPSAARIFAKEGFRLFQVSAAIKDCKCFGGNPNCPMKIRARACRMVKEYPSDYNGIK
jgi:hypothetical protein